MMTCMREGMRRQGCGNNVACLWQDRPPIAPRATLDTCPGSATDRGPGLQAAALSCRELDFSCLVAWARMVDFNRPNCAALFWLIVDGVPWKDRCCHICVVSPRYRLSCHMSRTGRYKKKLAKYSRTLWALNRGSMRTKPRRQAWHWGPWQPNHFRKEEYHTWLDKRSWS